MTLVFSIFIFKINSIQDVCSFDENVCGLGGLVVSAFDFHAGYRGFESRSGRDNFRPLARLAHTRRGGTW